MNSLDSIIHLESKCFRFMEISNVFCLLSTTDFLPNLSSLLSKLYSSQKSTDFANNLIFKDNLKLIVADLIDQIWSLPHTGPNKLFQIEEQTNEESDNISCFEEDRNTSIGDPKPNKKDKPRTRTDKCNYFPIEDIYNDSNLFYAKKTQNKYSFDTFTQTSSANQSPRGQEHEQFKKTKEQRVETKDAAIESSFYTLHSSESQRFIQIPKILSLLSRKPKKSKSKKVIHAVKTQ